MSKVRVHVDLTIEVNADAWSEMYGTDPEAVPDDVRKYAMSQIWQSAAVAERAIYSVGLVPKVDSGA